MAWRSTRRPTSSAALAVADALLEPTAIYVRAVLELLRSDVPVHGLAHITGGGVLNLLRIGSGIGYRDLRTAAESRRSSA